MNLTNPYWHIAESGFEFGLQPIDLKLNINHLNLMVTDNIKFGKRGPNCMSIVQICDLSSIVGK